MEPGDLILTQTPTPLYGVFRDVGQTSYDHIVAVVDEERSLHVSFPLSKLVPTTLFIRREKVPLVLKCKAMTTEDKHRMIEHIKHTLVAKSYDYKRITHFFFATKLSQFGTSPLLNRL